MRNVVIILGSGLWIANALARGHTATFSGPWWATSIFGGLLALSVGIAVARREDADDAS